jgi:hypothetical protein
MMLVIGITRRPYAAAIDDSVHRTDKTMTGWR